ncbi:uncharacterized protein E0L32_004418 [Thyridium curvatum]|uniref:FAD-binding PCMH-type domain-containing protein n=1 Tax=Thyridium curvatum TaxID=1093900 RepID=A0A507BFE4_9PEZI|nr:uncharacterized protein E0L32_004418 [Thyridium curvatum]TPX15438.1 hypothetical protein E0L32_004418 [Thyridium curvatum]
MGSAALDLSKTEAFLKGVRIPFVSPSATEFGVLSKTFMHSPEQPTGIAQPGTAEEVATIIKHCIAEKVPFVVRTGGHDVTKSTLVANVLSINLRKLDHVQVSADKKTARVGGGILSGALLEALAPHGLEVPTAAVPSVGWLSCATMAGYTLMSPSMGLCCDSLLGAKVVDAKGEIVEASERMMKGIRGGGGNFGVIVEFTVKVHPLLEAQSGAIMYESSDPQRSWSSFLTKFQELMTKEKMPHCLSILPSLIAVPNMGPAVFAVFYWRGARDDAFQYWLKKAGSLGQAVVDLDKAVVTQSALTFTKGFEALLPPKMYGAIHSSCGSELTPEAIEVFGKYGAAMPPAGGSSINFHVLREGTPSCGKPSDFPDSVFGARRPHWMCEFIGGSGAGEEQGAEAAQWAKEIRDALAKTGAVTKFGYAATTSKEFAVVEDVFGENAAELRALKKEFDPDNVFRCTVPLMD